MRSLKALCLVVIFFQANVATEAGVNYNKWNYAIDSFDDGSGGSSYELRGLAIKIGPNRVSVGISGGLPEGGVPVDGALNGRISLGDAFFNFSAHNLDAPGEFNSAGVLGVRFAPDNDSFGNTPGTPNSLTGVFDGLSVTAVAGANNGYGSLQSYVDTGFGRSTDAMGDLENSSVPAGDVIQYFGNGAMLTNILSGSKLGNIVLLDRAALASRGLDFGHFAGADPVGNQVYGFSFNRSLLPNGDFTLHLFEECINDGVALKGTAVPAVPEPAAVIQAASALGIGLIACARRIRKRPAA